MVEKVYAVCEDERVATALDLWIDAKVQATNAEDARKAAIRAVTEVFTTDYAAFDGIQIQHGSDRYRFQLTIQIRPTLDQKLLLERGVTADVIAACTVDKRVESWRFDKLKSSAINEE